MLNMHAWTLLLDGGESRCERSRAPREMIEVMGIGGLGPRELDALADLEARTVAHDGGRLKLEWGTLRAREGKRVEDFVARDGDTLVGFLGLYAFGAPNVEIAMVVDPSHRRHGIGSALLDAALPVCRERAYEKVLLVTPRVSDAGAAFAKHRGATLDHAEHALVLTGPPRVRGAWRPDLEVRRATTEDVPAITRLLGETFMVAPSDVAARLHDETAESRVVVLGGAVVGTLRVTRDGDTAGLYGFAIEARLRGRGLGREVLERTCRAAHEAGASRVALEVLVDNDHALGLYTSVGFVRTTSEDYYALPPG